MSTIRILISYSEAKCVGDPLDNKNFQFKFFNLNEYDRPSFYKLIREYRPDIIFTVGENKSKILSELSFNWRKRWSHVSTFDKITDKFIEKCFIHSIYHKDPNHPLISVVSTTYRSGDKIFRPYKSLIESSYNNWEWIVYDDSDDSDTTWNTLLGLYETDYRITLIKSNKNDGIIGSVKFKASMMAQGDYIAEFDHDDLLHKDTLRWLVDAGKLYPDAGFLYTNTCPIYEETGKSLVYGEFIGFGYAGYEAIKLDNKWMYCLLTAKLNPTTIRHLVGLPNHLRVWRTEHYRKVSGNNPRLSVADDYELLVKSFLETRYVYIPEPGYIQYHNTGGNNFTYIRNSMIQILVRYVYNHYQPKILERFNQLGTAAHVHRAKCWEAVKETHYPTFEHVYFPNIEKTVSIILPLVEYKNNLLEKLANLINILNKQTYTHWRLHISASGIKQLTGIMDTLLPICDSRVRWWNMNENAENIKTTATNYALKIMAKSKYISYVRLNSKWSENRLQELMNGIGQKDCFVDRADLIHLNSDKYSYWLPEENKEEFVKRCNI